MSQAPLTRAPWRALRYPEGRDRANGLTKQVTVVRVEPTTGRVYYRRSHKRKRLFAHSGGFASLRLTAGALYLRYRARRPASLR
jgi:hypothetical protein